MDSSYDFIVNQQAPKKSWLPSFNSRPARILVVVVGLSLVILLASLGYSLLTGAKRGQTDKLIDIAARQNEIIRVSEQAADKAKDADTRGLATTAQLSLVSSQKQVIDLVKRQGHRVSAAELNRFKDSKTDDQLKTAEQNGNYDAVYTTFLKAYLATYRDLLKQTFSTAHSNNEKLLLDSSYRQANTLLGS